MQKLTDSSVIVFKFHGMDNKSQELKVRRKYVGDALTWITGTDENGEPKNLLYKGVTKDCDLLESFPVDEYLSETKSVDFDIDGLEFDSDYKGLFDIGPMNSDENFYKEDTGMGSFFLGNLNFKKEKVIINNEVLSQQTHKLTLASKPMNEVNTKYLASLWFPTHFSDAKGYPKNSQCMRLSHLQKILSIW